MIKRLEKWLLPGVVGSALLGMLLLFVFHVPNLGGLTGFIPSNYPSQINVKSIFDGSFQNGIDKWISDNFCGHNFWVRCYNQIKYSVFSEGTGAYTVGKDGYLYNKYQTYQWAAGKAGNTWSEKEFDEYALNVRRMQDTFEALGKDFFYLLTPIKAEIYPEKLPAPYAFLAKRYSEQEHSTTVMLKAALTKQGVHWYDATDALKDYEAKEKGVAFHNTGHHWTIEATAYSLNRIFQEVRLLQKIELPGIQQVGERKEIFATDKDLYSLQNIFGGIQNDNYITPIINYDYISNNNLYIFGTSYGWEMKEALFQNVGNRAFNQLIYQQYFTHRVIADGMGDSRSEFTANQKPAELDIMSGLRDSDVIIMEQVKSLGIMDTHVKWLDYVNSNLGTLYYTLGNDMAHYTEDFAAVKFNNFHDLEDWGRWSKGNTCSVKVYSPLLLEKKSDLHLQLSANACVENYNCTVLMNNIPIGDIELRRETEIYELNIPREIIESDVNEITFAIDGIIHTPSDLGISDDRRSMGIGIHSLTIKEVE